MKAANSSALQRLDYLDSVRALAALAVLGTHYFGCFGPPPGAMRLFTKPLISLFYDGRAAVAIFFVLSGFVLSLRPVRLYGIHYSLREEMMPFLLSRACRLLLPYWAMVLISDVVCRYGYTFTPVVFGGTPFFLSLWQHVVAHDLFNHFTFAHVWLIPQGWTLAIEWYGSLVLPFMLLAANNGMFYLAIFIIWCLFLFGASSWIVAFGFGMAIVIHLENIQRLLNSFNVMQKSALLLTGFLILNTFTLARYVDMVSPVCSKFLMAHIELITSMGAAIVISCVLSSRRLQHMLQHKIWLFYGKISYSFYLVHLLVIITITPRALNGLYGSGLRNLTLLNIVGYFFTIAASTFLASIMYVIIERPSICLGKFLTGRLRGGFLRHNIRANAEGIMNKMSNP